MLFKYNVNNYTLNECGVVVALKREKITILFHEIDEVYVRLYKVKFEFLLSLIILVISLFFLLYLPLNWISVIPFVSIIVLSVKNRNYRRFKL